jgi:flavin-dependent dehydrogenase
MTQVETAIVGGGPAGAATACGLAAAGREVLLIERADGPHHKVCGEFLSVETQAQLHRLNIDPLNLGAVTIDEVSVHSMRREVTSALPFRALSLSRLRLDQAMLRRAVQCGAQVKMKTSVRSVRNDGAGGWALRCDDGEEVGCRNLVLATGKRGLRGIDDERDHSLVGLKMHLRPSPATARALQGRVELVLLERTYAGLELVEDGIANLCLLLPRAEVARLGLGWPALRDYLSAASPCLAERIEGAEPLFDKPLAVVCPSGGHLHGEEGPALYRVGDRLAHIPPFTGDGLAIAFSSAALTAEHVLKGRTPAQYLVAARNLTRSSLRLAGAVSALAATNGGRAALMAAAAFMPGFVRNIVRHTRLPLSVY